MKYKNEKEFVKNLLEYKKQVNNISKITEDLYGIKINCDKNGNCNFNCDSLVDEAKVLNIIKERLDTNFMGSLIVNGKDYKNMVCD